VGLTPTGRATAALLKFNLSIRVDNRRLLMDKKRYPPASLSFASFILKLK